jgi:hypothetical protein
MDFAESLWIKSWLPIIDELRTNSQEINQTIQQAKYCFGVSFVSQFY